MNLSADVMTAVLNASNDGILVAEFKGTQSSVVYSNAAFRQLTGYSDAELRGRNLIELWHDPDDEILQSALRDGTPCTCRLRTPTKDGRFLWNQLRTTFFTGPDKIAYIVAIHKDITQEEYLKSVLEKVNLLYREMSKRLEYTSETDHLTQLKNRGHLSTRGEFMLGAAKREKLRLHAILVDVDSLKALTTLGGGNLADECLIKVAEIIKQCFSRATDIAIRMCDGEFVVICIEDDDRWVWERAESLRSEVRDAKIKDSTGRLHDISVSIAIYSITPEKHTTIEEIIQRAGELLFQTNPGSPGRIAHNKANEHRLFRH